VTNPDQPHDPWTKKGAGDQPGEPPQGGQTYGAQPYPGQQYPQEPYGQQPYPQQPYSQQPYPQQPYPGQPYGGAPGYPPYGSPQGAYAAMVNFPKPTGWFIVTWLFLWPLAIYSLVSAWSNIDRALLVGDYAGAQYQAGRVRKFGIISLCVSIGIYVLMFTLFFVVFAASTSSTSVQIGP
jgi:hypothetical protein